jgi:hypothetical protein
MGEHHEGSLSLSVEMNPGSSDNPELQHTMSQLGRHAYEAYCSATGGKSLVSRETLPAWSEQTPEIQGAWTMAAMAVAREILA